MTPAERREAAHTRSERWRCAHGIVNGAVVHRRTRPRAFKGTESLRCRSDNRASGGHYRPSLVRRLRFQGRAPYVLPVMSLMDATNQIKQKS